MVQTLSDEGARLVTAQGETIEVAHEALIRGWSRLRGWIEADREGLRLQHRLAVSAAEWAANGRDDSYLWSGARLAEAQEWAEAHRRAMNVEERAFVRSSLRVRDRAERIEKRRRKKELEQAERIAETQKARAREQAQSAARLRKGAWGLGMALLVALLAFGGALWFWRQSVAQTRRAESERIEAERQQSIAESGQLVFSAELIEDDPHLAILLGIEAVRRPNEQISSTLSGPALNTLQSALDAWRWRGALQSGHRDAIAHGGMGFKWYALGHRRT